MFSKFNVGSLLQRYGLWFFVLIVLRSASAPTADLAYVLLIGYALRSRGHAIEALFLSFVFNNLNPAIFPAASTSEIARYLVVTAAALSVARSSSILKSGRIDPISAMVFLFTAFIATHSLLFSAIPAISFLKSVIWGLSFFTLIEAWRDNDPNVSARVLFRIYTTLMVCIVVSLILTGQPAAYVPRTTFLQGVFGHSQLLGLVSAMMLVWTFANLLSDRRPSFALMGLLAIAGTVVVLTNSRTAILSAVIVMPLLIVIAVSRKSSRSSWALPGLRNFRFMLLLLASSVTLFAASSTIQGALLKGSQISLEQASLVTLYGDSRGGLAAEMWDNIQKAPLVGIGFGLASNPDLMEISYFQGVPVGAVVEKGITPLAVWEEVGVLGLLLFLILLIQIMVRGFALGPDKLSVLLVILVLNLGEATLLSAGGAGLIQLVLLGWVISGKRKIRGSLPKVFRPET